MALPQTHPFAGHDEVSLPDELAGLPRRRVAGAPEAVGLYGSGVTLLAVVREGTPFPNPAPDFRLEAGDDLVLMGSHEEIERAFDALGG